MHEHHARHRAREAPAVELARGRREHGKLRESLRQKEGEKHKRAPGKAEPRQSIAEGHRADEGGHGDDGGDEQAHLERVEEVAGEHARPVAEAQPLRPCRGIGPPLGEGPEEQAQERAHDDQGRENERDQPRRETTEGAPSG